jgi:uncharacterized protein involved in cysteine biosynthesis
MQELTAFVKEQINSGSFWTKWFWYILLVVVSLGGVIVLALNFIQKGNKLAAMEHERDVLRQDVIANKVNQDLLGKEEHKQEQLTLAKSELELAAKANVRRVQLNQQNKTDKDKINNLKSWKDVKKNVKFKPKP